MPDVWSAVANLERTVQDRLADVLETRGADPQQQAMRRSFLAEIVFPPNANVLEVGCGTGVLTRMLARFAKVGRIVGVDAAPSLIARARELGTGLSGVSFEEADARKLPFGDASFDAVLFDSTLCHVPEPSLALAEAFRVLRPAGRLAGFDGDYATTTVAVGDYDPLQCCVEAMMAGSVHDRWLVRRLPAMVRACGFEEINFRTYGFAAIDGGYMLTIIDRGADILQAQARIQAETAAALKGEARRRVDLGTFFGQIAYASLIARKPG
jgi:ubiquinone/menaquinone biosynthesis C-methylase UbiE